jgi:hypothetical protein
MASAAMLALASLICRSRSSVQAPGRRCLHVRHDQHRPCAT